MHLSIHQILLWPKSERHEVRTLEFKPDKINLVTGPSRTGKSAITYIIDYVLGSGKCPIPVGEIRSAVAWYGLLLDIDGGQILVAREDPGSRIGSENYYVDEREDIVIPKQPEKNTNRAAFKARMDLLAGLPNLDFGGENIRAGFLGRPSFRDMAAFNFLPQHVVANPYTLFFKADTTEHRSKLGTIFPFVLGVVGIEHLVAEHELAELEKRFRRLTAQLNQRKRAAESWKAEAYGLHGRAVALGLLPQETQRPGTLSSCLQALAQIPDSVSTERQLPARTPGTTLVTAQRLEDVREKERGVDRVLGEVRIRLNRVRGLRQAVEDFEGVAADQSGRVLGVGWLAGRLREQAECPICGNQHDGAIAQMEQLAAAADDLAERQRIAGEAPIALQREEHGLLVEVRQQEELLQAFRAERLELEAERERGGGQALEDVFRFVGRVEEALRNLSQTEDGSELVNERNELDARIAELRATANPQERQRRLDAALQLFSRHASHYAQFLGLERRDDAIDLNLMDLTLVFTSQAGGRHDYLWEIGSGANWMGYHIATFLSLHEMFLGMSNSPVPAFLVIDQPSQVYFPAGWPAKKSEEEDELPPQDVQATRRIFEALSDGMNRLGHRLQIIVTEHADSQTIGELPNVYTAADWHGDDKDYLIPRAWLEQ